MCVVSMFDSLGYQLMEAKMTLLEYNALDTSIPVGWNKKCLRHCSDLKGRKLQLHTQLEVANPLMSGHAHNVLNSPFSYAGSFESEDHLSLLCVSLGVCPWAQITKDCSFDT